MFNAIKDMWRALRLLTKVRPSVLAFALQMEDNLKVNDWKGGWEALAPETILRRLREETDELEEAYKNPSTDIILEAADIANFAMFAAENFARELVLREMK